AGRRGWVGACGGRRARRVRAGRAKSGRVTGASGSMDASRLPPAGRPGPWGGRPARGAPMPPTPVPADVDAFLRQPNPAVVASLRPDGSPHTAATWYDWDGERVYLNMDHTRLRLRFMRRDGRIAVTVLHLHYSYL